MGRPPAVGHRRRVQGDAHPRLLRGLRVPHPGRHPGLLPGQRQLTVLDRTLLDGPVESVASALLGQHLVRDDATGRRLARIVEVEAYGGMQDRASHARFGPTARNAVMSGPPGIAYVYLVYGMYDCLNVVTGPDRTASAVLIRAVEPLEGEAVMRADRVARLARRRRLATDPTAAAAAAARLATTPVHRLAAGPGLVAAAFGLDTTWTGRDLCDPDAALRLERGTAVAPADVVAGPRVGVGYAGPEWAGRPWRFRIAGHRSTSRG